MAAPAPSGVVRKKRNFKALQLDVSQPPPPEPELAPIRLAPARGGAPGGKKRPPPMIIKAPKIGTSTTTVETDNGLLAANGAGSAPPTASASETRMTYHNTLSTTLANLDMNSENKYHDLQNEDLKDMQELGQGNGGSVKKVEHVPTGTIMAKKVRSHAGPHHLPYLRIILTIQIVLIDAKPSVRKQILRELQIMHDCNSNYIISFFGAFISDPNICICMEFMDKGSLDGIYKKIGPIDIDVVGKVALAVLEGLTYLYDVHRIIHRGTSYFVPLQDISDRYQTSNPPTSFATRKGRSKFVILACQENSLIQLRTLSLGHLPT